MSWMDSANCKGRTELFFAPAGERPPSRFEREAQAKRVCQGCSVSVECGLAAAGNFGIWAGQPEDTFLDNRAFL